MVQRWNWIPKEAKRLPSPSRPLPCPSPHRPPPTRILIKQHTLCQANRCTWPDLTAQHDCYNHWLLSGRNIISNTIFSFTSFVTLLELLVLRASYLICKIKIILSNSIELLQRVKVDNGWQGSLQGRLHSEISISELTVSSTKAGIVSGLLTTYILRAWHRIRPLGVQCMPSELRNRYC